MPVVRNSGTQADEGRTRAYRSRRTGESYTQESSSRARTQWHRNSEIGEIWDPPVPRFCARALRSTTITRARHKYRFFFLSFPSSAVRIASARAQPIGRDDKIGVTVTHVGRMNTRRNNTCTPRSLLRTRSACACARVYAYMYAGMCARTGDTLAIGRQRAREYVCASVCVQCRASAEARTRKNNTAERRVHSRGWTDGGRATGVI